MPIALGFQILSFFGLSDRLAKRFAPLALAGLALVVMALCIAAFMWWLDGREEAAVSAHRAKASVEALDTARGADEAAEAATAGNRKDVEDGNERAREAAAGSDDPLGDALRSLRYPTGPDR